MPCCAIDDVSRIEALNAIAKIAEKGNADAINEF